MYAYCMAHICITAIRILAVNHTHTRGIVLTHAAKKHLQIRCARDAQPLCNVRARAVNAVARCDCETVSRGEHLTEPTVVTLRHVSLIYSSCCAWITNSRAEPASKYSWNPGMFGSSSSTSRASPVDWSISCTVWFTHESGCVFAHAQAGGLRAF